MDVPDAAKAEAVKDITGKIMQPNKRARDRTNPVTLKFHVHQLVMKTAYVCERRIVNGTVSWEDRRFMVYFVSSKHSIKHFDGWLCGGAIVSPRKILTSASCLLDTDHIYAIAGYKKYVPANLIDEDECTKERKQKVVKICTPKAYALVLEDSEKWGRYDVGIAVVEKPYDYTDLTYRLHCSYVPNEIKIAYDPLLEAKNTSVLLLGWGHKLRPRVPGDILDHNSEYLNEAMSEIAGADHCHERIAGWGNFKSDAGKSFLCVDGETRIDPIGNPFSIDAPIEHCGQIRRRGQPDPRCVRDGNVKIDDMDYYYDYDFRRKDKENSTNAIKLGKFIKILRMTTNTKEKKSNKGNKVEAYRRVHGGGLCQNDHGGPLVTWIGTQQVVIGVAMNSHYTAEYYCNGPSVFTSTLCASTFLKCLLETTVDARKRCKSVLNNEGVDIHERNIEWWAS